MLTAIFMKELQNLYQKKSEALYDQIDITFIPVINVGTYKMINNAWLSKDPEWEGIKMSRKNRRPCTGLCESKWICGVDINRNYGYKFGVDNVGSSVSECGDDHRGSHAFSEPETQSIKKIFDKNHGFLVSAVSLHSYGPLVLNSMQWDDKQNKDLENYPRYAAFVRELKKANPSGLKSIKYGNASQAIDYSANGDAIDWMLDEHDVFGVTMEIGNDDEASQDFYPPAESIPSVLKDFYPNIRHFLDFHQTKLVNVAILSKN